MKTDASLTEEQLNFYLEEARTMCPSAVEGLSEHRTLSILHGRLRRIVRLLTLIQEDTRSNDLHHIQRACGYYLVQDSVPRPERISFNKRLSNHIDICNQLTGERDIAGYTLDYFTRQLHDLEQYLRQKQE